jgi:hypothetical protein
MSTETERWIEAGKTLAVDPAAKVSCPRCLDAYLMVTDVTVPNQPGLMERHMQCPKCDAYNAARIQRPPLVQH